MVNKQIFFTVGPSQLYPTVPQHLKQALKEDIMSISHRGSQFTTLYETALESLKELIDIPSTSHIFFTASSLESMERIIENCVFQNSFHFINGAFSRKFYDFAKLLKKNPQKYEVKSGQGFDFDKMIIPKEAELICLTQNETSSGVSLDMEDIYQIKNRYPDKLIALDIVSSSPYTKIDFEKIDMAFFSVQKGFGLPAGLGVLIVNEKAIEKTEKLQKLNINIGSFHNFLSFAKLEEKFQTPETPNVLAIYLLGKVAQDMLDRGIEEIRKETEQKSDYIYNYFNKHKSYKPFVKEKKWQSKTTIVIDVNNTADLIAKKLSKKGLTIAKGYGEFKDTHLRIANFPAHRLSDFQKLLKLL